MTPAAAEAPTGATGGPSTGPHKRVNDLAFKIGTVNGTGSASANGLLRQAIFRMGIPVSGKNLFPSNIQGLPTRYEIRANEKGHTARTSRFDLFVAMNPASYEKDIAEVTSGGWVIHDSTWPLAQELRREDVHFLGIPLARMCVEHFEGSRTRILMKNICYVGALSALLNIDMEEIKGLVGETFASKQKLLDSNHLALDLGFDYAKEHFQCPLPVHLEPSDRTEGSILIDGNTAAALGCIYAGATVAAWYPITPSTSLVDAFTAFSGEFRTDPETGRRKVAIIQAEDELAAAGMVIGAGWAGARAFTSTSGAGLSLMGEFVGLAYYAEVPSVFFDVQRVGPSTGMPTRTQQGDLQFLAYASHGDTKHILLMPAHPGECFDLAVAAFDLAERYQTPVFVLSDLDIGMNDWVVPALSWDDGYEPDRGKVVSAEELEAAESFYRYLDVDGDGIPQRSLPGVHPDGAYFTRGSGHDKHGRYTEDSAPYTEVVDRLLRKVEGAAPHLPEPEVRMVAEDGPARIGLVTFGVCRGAVLEAMDVLAERQIPADYLRVKAFPFHPDVEGFLEDHEVNYVIEQNRDGQLRNLLLLETGVTKDRLRSVRYYGGLPMSAHHVLSGLSQTIDGLDDWSGAEGATS
ncbi:MAG: 2-oxoacid:acceptor oxidoreductase subunit alpha [Gemmatimonadetes bacterium]|nr:2-oxoacid:acceptor oxidoreductase subunit alpha [Gemmatimonadota bacterium]